MSQVDFSQDAKDHGCIHIAVEPLGETSGPIFAATLDVLQNMTAVHLTTELKGNTVLFLRFLSSLPRWATDDVKWSDLAAYKQILGVLAITQCHDVDDVANIQAGFKQNCQKFNRTLCDSRCIVYGPKKVLEDCIDPKKGFHLVDCSLDHEAFTKEDVSVQRLEEIVTDFVRSIHLTLMSQIGEFSKQVGSVGRAPDQVKLLRTPFDLSVVKDRAENEPGEPRHFSRHHMQCRVTKHLGDIFLLCGQLQDASAHYNEATESLKSHKDWLWAGSAYEGLAATALITRECEEVLGQKAQGTASGQSFFTPVSNLFKVGSSSRLSRTPGGIGRSATLPTSVGSAKRGGNMLEPNPFVSRSAKYATHRRGMKSPSPEPSSLPTSLVEEVEVTGDSGFSNGIDVSDDGGGLSMVDSDEGRVTGDSEEIADGEEGEESEFYIDERLLRKDFIVDKYSLAVHFYSKAGPIGGLSQMEALIKFAKYLVSQKRYARAGETLQRMVKVNSFITEIDKISLYKTMAAVFKSMNFQRKAALFTHYAALQSNAMAKTNQDYYNAHRLLEQCLPGYRLSLSAGGLVESNGGPVGWPSLQACILKDYVFLARTLQENLVAIGHTCFLLQTLYKHLNEANLAEVTEMLDDIVKEAEESTTIVPKQGELQSPIALTEFPHVTSFIPQNLPPQLTPHKYEWFKSQQSIDANSPFIYSALSVRKKKQPEILYVQGDAVEVTMVVSNPLPFELHVENMVLITEGVKVQVFPSSLTLPAKSEPQPFVLPCIPQESGILNVLGYEASVFGVRNRVMVKIPDSPILRVIPPLPQSRLRVFPNIRLNGMGEGGQPKLQRNASRSSVGAVDKFDLMDGEVYQCEVRLDCMRDATVEKASFYIKDNKDDYCDFTWDDSAIQSLLPLKKDQIGSFSVELHCRFPSWTRVTNDITAGMSHLTLFSFSPSTIALGDHQRSSSQENIQPSSFDCDRSPPPTSTGAATPPRVNMSPSGSPLVKRSTKRPMNFLIFNSMKRKSSHIVGPENDSRLPPTSFDHSLIGSLDLQHPAVFGTRAHKPPYTLSSKTNMRQKRPSRPLKQTLEEYDFDRFNNRASVRSDPGDEFLGQAPNKSRWSLKPKVTDTKSVPLPKSESVAFGMSGIANEGPEVNQRLSALLSDGSRAVSSLPRGVSRTGSRKGPLSKEDISHPTGPLYQAVHRPPPSKRVVEFVMEYSGEEGSVEGYFREVKTTITVNIRPNLIFDQFDVQPVEESKELFFLKFTVQNIAKCKLEVTWTTLQAGLSDLGVKTEEVMTLDPNGKRAVSVTMLRFLLPETNAFGVKNESITTTLYCDRVAELIKFHWKAVDMGRSGNVTLDGLRLPMSNISIIKPEPLLFDVSLNGQVCPMQGMVMDDLRPGIPLTATIEITNNSGQRMSTFLLVLDVYQFSQEQKKIIRDLTNKMVFTGNLTTTAPELEAGDNFQHSLTLLFLHKGTYQFDVKVQQQIAGSPSNTPPVPRKTATDTKPGAGVMEKPVDKSAREFESRKVASQSKEGSNTKLSVSSNVHVNLPPQKFCSVSPIVVGEQKQSGSKPTDPKPTLPKPSDPKPSDPKQSDPKPSDTKPTVPKPTDPQSTVPKPTVPKPSDPKSTVPKQSGPKPTETKQSDPKPNGQGNGLPFELPPPKRTPLKRRRRTVPLGKYRSSSQSFNGPHITFNVT